jgi:hypothetical protein
MRDIGSPMPRQFRFDGICDDLQASTSQRLHPAMQSPGIFKSS